MKIFFAVVVIVLLFVIGATLYVYKKSAMFLPALGICGFPKIKESSYYDENGHFRPGTGRTKLDFSCSIRYSAVLNICFQCGGQRAESHCAYKV